MELLQLKYFCDAAQTQNFSKTARKFMVPVSNISQTVKRLEKELGAPLFDRHTNRIKLNEAGAIFYKNARSALELLENAEKTIKNTRKAGTIKINIQITRRVVMEMIESYRKLHPEISFITAHNTDESCEGFDIIITDKELKLPYVKTKAAEESFLLAYNKNEAAFSSDINASRPENLPFITMSPGSSIYENTLKLCTQLGFAPNIVLQSEDPFYIRKCVELGLGITVVPELSWRGQFSENVALKKIGEIKREIYVYKKHTADEHINEFCEMLMEKFAG